jgi:hypothetical protein
LDKVARSFEQLDDAVDEDLSRLDGGYRFREKLGVNTVVRFGHLTDAFEDQRLRSVERREVSSATRSFCKLDSGDGTSLV